MSGDFSFLKGNINTIILCSLYGKDGKSGDKYGYEIAKEIKERTDNKYEIKQPTLYSYLKRLEQQQQIESYWGTESNGGRRRYYKLTPKGKRDCEQFMAEWEYHKTVLSTLVDTSENTLEVSQEDVTPLFGEKHKQKPQKPIRSAAIDEQDEIARQLDALIGKTQEESESYSDVKQQEKQVIYEEQEAPAYVEEEPAPQPQETVVATTAVETVEEKEDHKSKFDVNQDDAEDFLLKFEERARSVSASRETPESESSENYQHVLMKVVGDQLDEMQQFSNEQQEGAQKYYTDHPVALEDVAESMAKEGIRMRIYNHASANYKSKTLMPNASILCKTAWLTFAVAAVYFAILIFTSITNNNWQPFLITLAVLALFPIALTFYALYDPSRKEKPKFMFGRFLTATATLAAIIVLFSIGLSIIAKIELNDYVAVSKQILIPTGIAILLPVYVSIYNYFYKKY